MVAVNVFLSLTAFTKLSFSYCSAIKVAIIDLSSMTAFWDCSSKSCVLMKIKVLFQPCLFFVTDGSCLVFRRYKLIQLFKSHLQSSKLFNFDSAVVIKTTLCWAQRIHQSSIVKRPHGDGDGHNRCVNPDLKPQFYHQYCR